MYRTFVMLLVIISLASQSLAQYPDEEKKAENVREYSAFAGVLLPNQIEGVTEQTGMWGLRYAWPKGHNQWIEPGAFLANAWGVTYYNLWLSYRMDIEVESLVGHFFIGPDIHRITRQTDPTGATPGDTTQNFIGGHLGGGISSPISDALWFRSDMKFNLNPGTALLVMFSFVFRIDQGATTEGAESR